MTLSWSLSSSWTIVLARDDEDRAFPVIATADRAKGGQFGPALLGAGQVLKQAIAELKALQAEEPERKLALPILVRLRLEVPIDPSKRTTEDQEFLMETQDVVESWRREAIQEGFMQGERAALLRLLRHRFGDQVDTIVEQRVAAASTEQIETWTVRVLTAATLAELFAN